MIGYFGGKASIGEWIYQYIPKDVTTYVEPFSGAFWVYMNPKNVYSNLNTVVYNDINKHMANLYTALSNPDKFLETYERFISPGGLLHDEKSEGKEFYKALYYKFKHDTGPNNFLDNPTSEYPDYDAAVTYAFLITSSFNSCFPRAAGFSFGSGKPKILTLINKLNKKEYRDKLKGITNIRSIDFEELIKKYDSPNTYFYLDPPYEDPKNSRLNWYGVNSDETFGRSSHERLAKVLANIKGKFSLSYYWFEELESWFPRDKYVWVEKDFFRSSAAFSDTKDTKGTELLIMNYNYEPTLPTQIIKITNKKMATKKKTISLTDLRKVLEQISKDDDIDVVMVMNEIENFLNPKPTKSETPKKPEFSGMKEYTEHILEISKKNVDEALEEAKQHVEPELDSAGYDSEGNNHFQPKKDIDKPISSSKKSDDFWD